MSTSTQRTVAPTAGSPTPSSAITAEDRSARRAVVLFPLLIVAAGIVGYLAPSALAPVVPWINPLLGVIMFGMGLSLTPPDVALVVRRPLPILLGVAAQYLIMPLAGWFVAWVMGLPPELAVGVILVGCAPGGTASNVVSYLAKADTALSVTMTSVSTLLAPLLTPLLTLWLAGQYMPVDGVAMARAIVMIVLLPVIGGLLLRVLAPRLVARLLPGLPWVSVATIATVVAAVVSKSADFVASAGLTVLLAVILHNTLGLALGYGFGALFRQDERVRGTMAIEVGMQNSGLAAGLAAAYFTAAAGLPGAVFSIWHNVSGSLFALWFRRHQERRARV